MLKAWAPHRRLSMRGDDFMMALENARAVEL